MMTRILFHLSHLCIPKVSLLQTCLLVYPLLTLKVLNHYLKTLIVFKHNLKTLIVFKHYLKTLISIQALSQNPNSIQARPQSADDKPTTTHQCQFLLTPFKHQPPLFPPTPILNNYGTLNLKIFLWNVRRIR